jgi:DNA-binding response OmpR family regulator
MVTQILLLADSPLLTGMLTMQLAEEGFRVHSLATSDPIAEPLTMHKPSLVILDMPPSERNGLELAAWLCLWRKIPLLVLTAPGASEKVRDQFRGAHVLAKPFTMDRMLGRIAEALGETRNTSVA